MLTENIGNDVNLRLERVNMTKAYIKEGTTTETRTLPQGLTGKIQPNARSGQDGTGRLQYCSKIGRGGDRMETRKGNIPIKLQRNVRTGQDVWEGR